MALMLKYEIKRMGMTQSRLAELINLNPSQLSGFVNGRRNVSPYWRNKIARAIGWRGDCNALFEECPIPDGEEKRGRLPDVPLPFSDRGTMASVDIAKSAGTMCRECPIEAGEGDEECEACMVRLISEISTCGGMLKEERLEHWREIIRTMAGRDSATF